MTHAYIVFNLVSVYHWSEGSGDFTLLGIQLIAVLFIFGWTFVVMGCYFTFLNYMGWLRIDPLEEEVGMDISRHKGSCYDYDSTPSEQVVAKLMEDRSTSGRGSKKATSVENKSVENNDTEGEA